MMFWSELVHIGDLPITLAAAAAVTIWLAAGRAWRIAFLWSLLFLLGIGLVVMTKVTFLAWGSPLLTHNFNAVSGHATGVTAVLPTIFFLLIKQYTSRPYFHRAGAAAGLTAGALMSVLLVANGDHSVVEVVAGWTIGTAISLSGIWLASALPPPPRYALWYSTAVFMVTLYSTHSFPFGYVMYRAAHVLRSNTVFFKNEAPARECKFLPKKEASCLPKKCVIQYSLG